MSYFSRAATNKCYEDDLNYPSPEMQLCWRLEELKARYEELIDKDYAYKNPLILMEDDLRYALPEHLHSIRHIKAAIELAEFDLRERYGIDTDKEQCDKDFAVSMLLIPTIHQCSLAM